jgi:PAS domain S-box-containing protein
MESSIRVGTPGGIWTDLAGPADGPANVVMGEAVEYQAADEQWRVGAGTAVPGAPWSTWVSSPRSLVLARADAFLTRIIPIALGIVLVGGLGAWLVLRALTAPLKRLTNAAQSMASGNYDQRVDIGGPHELSALTDAFNHLAGRVQDAQQDLEQRVEVRTAELRASEDQFRNVAATARDTIIMADTTGCITYFNAGAEDTFQYRADEVIGQPLTALMPPRFHEAHQRGFERHVATGESRVLGRTIELTGRRKDDSEFPLELSLSSWNRNGERVFAGIIRDITAWKESEAELQRYAAQLEAANEELEAFAYSVSHDLRAPLRAVHGYCHVLVEDYAKQLDEEGIRYAGRVSAGVERMGRLIDDLLEMSRVTRAEMTREAVHLDLIAEEVIDELRRDSDDREVEIRIARGLEVDGDSRLLRLVMQNLLHNAWKFTSRRQHGRIEVGALEGADQTFYVRDNGAGFDMTYADKLFGAFQRLHKSADFPGTGVGLAIVHRIIQRHGGRVWADAAEGRGATFYFDIPAPV